MIMLAFGETPVFCIAHEQVLRRQATAMPVFIPQLPRKDWRKRGVGLGEYSGDFLLLGFFQERCILCTRILACLLAFYLLNLSI